MVNYWNVFVFVKSFEFFAKIVLCQRISQVYASAQLLLSNSTRSPISYISTQMLNNWPRRAFRYLVQLFAIYIGLHWRSQFTKTKTFHLIDIFLWFGIKWCPEIYLSSRKFATTFFSDYLRIIITIYYANNSINDNDNP